MQGMSEPKNTKQRKSNRKYKPKQSVTKKSSSLTKRVCSSNLFLKLGQFFERFLFFIRHFLESSLPFLLGLFNHFFCFFGPPGFEFRFSLFNLKNKTKALQNISHFSFQECYLNLCLCVPTAQARKREQNCERVRKTRSEDTGRGRGAKI